MGRRSARGRGGWGRPARDYCVTGRPPGQGAASDAKTPNRMVPPRCRSGFPDLAIMSCHRGHMGSHSPGCKPCVLVPNGEVDAGVLAEFPLAEALEVLIEAGTAFEHRLPQGSHHGSKNLIVSRVTNRQVEPHALRGRGLTPVKQGFMRLKNRLNLADLSIRAPLTSETGYLDLDDLARFKEIVSHALIDRSGKGRHAPLIRRRLRNEHTLAMPDLNFAEQLEAVQGLSKSGTPDSQFSGQLTLRRNTRPFRQATNDI